MRYYLIDETLIIRGDFHACSTGTRGGIRTVTSLVNHTIHDAPSSAHPDRTIELVARRAGLSPTLTFGLLTAVPMQHLCIARYEQITLFVTAGTTHPDPITSDIVPEPEEHQSGTINIICCISEGMADQGLLDAIITVTEAKAIALRSLGHSYAGTVTDAVIVAAEGQGSSRYAGSATLLGKRIHEAVIHAVSHALSSFDRKENERTDTFRPAFFIHTSIGGGRWIEWQKEGCPYYPCHFQGQRCDYCYCPLYPCNDESLGEWTSRSFGNEKIWSCAPCVLNHQHIIVRHLQRNPEASVRELKSLRLLHSGCIKKADPLE